MKKLKALILILLLVTSGVVSAFEIFSPESAEQGTAFTVFVSNGDGNSGVELILRRGEIIYSKTSAFTAEIEGRNADIALLGVPAAVAPGDYTISAINKTGESVENNIRVVKKQFITEEIALSRDMSNLRQSEDILKARQWRELLQILKTVDPDSVYEPGNLLMPVESLRKTSFYGDRRIFRYDDGTSASSIHNGVDYSAEPGTPVIAAGSGRVVFSGDRILTGLTVVIEHLPGVYSLYYHLDSLGVDVNQIVQAGVQVGTVGATGLVTGAHLHWEVRVAGVAVDPEMLIGASIIDKSFILSKME